MSHRVTAPLDVVGFPVLVSPFGVQKDLGACSDACEAEAVGGVDMEAGTCPWRTRQPGLISYYLQQDCRMWAFYG